MGENTLYKMYSKYILHTKKVSDVLILELAKSWWIFAAMPRATLSTTTYIPLSGLSVFLINSKWHENFTHQRKSISSKLMTSQIQRLLAVSIINAINGITINWVYVNYIYNRALNFLYYLFSSFPLNLEWLQIRNSHHYYKSNRQKKLEVFCLATFYREIGMVEQCIYLLTYY